LIELNGFGQKTQADLINKLEYFLVSKNKFHYAALEKDANVLLEKIQTALPDAQVSWVGEMRRACPIVNVMEFLIASDDPVDAIFEMDFLTLEKKEANHFVAKNENEKPVTIWF
jgi:DNA polymerase (family 10)